MALDKSIQNGREHRKPYHGSKVFDYTCRNHGGKGKKHDAGQCPWCRENRLNKFTVSEIKAKEEMEEVLE